MKNKTTIVITHRLNTIVDSDKIFFIEKGKIVEYGKHAELLERKGKYFDLYIRQVENVD